MRWYILVPLLLALTTPLVVHSQQAAVDPSHSFFYFDTQTHFGQHIRGEFPVYESVIHRYAEGLRGVYVRLYTRSVEIPNRPLMTSRLRSSTFFDAEQFPFVVFQSALFPESVLVAGGDITGQLTIRNVTHQETFHVVPLWCSKAIDACNVRISGTILRDNYGMASWAMLLDSQVTFSWQGHLPNETTSQ